MIPAVTRIQDRIREIESSFNRFSLNGVAEPQIGNINKPFSDYMNEATIESESIKVDASNNIDTMNPLNTEDIMANAQRILGKITEENTQRLNDALRKAYTVDMIEDNQSLPTFGEIYTTDTNNFSTKYDSIIKEAAEEYSIPESLIKAVIKQESNYKPDAVSHMGAVGLMQLMPKTAEGLGVSADKLTDPHTNIMAGSKYLSQMSDRYDGKLELILSAYNAGPTLVDRVQRVPNIDETQNYVKTIIDYLR